MTAAYNRTKAKAEVFAEKAGVPKGQVYDSLDALLKDPTVDAVDVLVPVQFNLQTVQQAIQAGKPIAVEKPISSNIKDAREIVSLTQKTALPVLVLENWVYHHSVAELKKQLPRIGRPVTFLFRSSGPYSPNKYHSTGWRQKPEHIGGYLSDGGVHQIALLTEVLGEVESVSGRTDSLRPEVSGDVDTLNALFNLKSGVFGTFIYGSYFGATKKTNTFIIFGTNGTIELDISPGGPKKVTINVGEDAKSASGPEVITIEDDVLDGVAAEFDNFAQAVAKRDKKLLQATPEKAFHHFAVIVAAVESAQNGSALTKVARP